MQVSADAGAAGLVQICAGFGEEEAGCAADDPLDSAFVPELGLFDGDAEGAGNLSGVVGLFDESFDGARRLRGGRSGRGSPCLARDRRAP